MKMVILDRDGVINQDSKTYIKSPEEWHPIEGSIQAIANLSKAGFKVVLATNQSGLARKLFSTSDLTNIHQKLISLVSQANGSIDGIFYCPHSPEANCSCRKPKTGLLVQIENKFNYSLESVPFVGDSVKDIQAGKSFGCKPMLVLTGNGSSSLKELQAVGEIDFGVFSNLAEASKYIILHAND